MPLQALGWWTTPLLMTLLFSSTFSLFLNMFDICLLMFIYFVPDSLPTVGRPNALHWFMNRESRG
jgi:hypothetical protein